VGLTKVGSGVLLLNSNNTYTGGTTVAAGTLVLSGAGTLGAASGRTTIGGGMLDLGGTTQTQAGVSLAGGVLQNGNLKAPISSTGGTLNGIGGTASLTTSLGITAVVGTNTYTGGTTINGGVVDVVGSIDNSTVNSGGILTGTGSAGATQINAGGTFAPGNGTAGSSMSVSGNLAFQLGSVYRVQLNPQASSFANVAGAATLANATVNAAFADGNYVAKRYTILSAAHGVSGSFGPLINTNLPTNFRIALSYGTNDVYLDLSLAFPNGLNGNQTALGNALTRFFNTTGAVPLAYGTLNAAQLSQVAGELPTGAQQTTLDAMNMFVGLLTDPSSHQAFVSNSAAGGWIGTEESGRASAYLPYNKSDGFAMLASAPATFERRWSVWAAGFGGSQSAGGNAATGTNHATSRVFGTAVGASYFFSPDTTAGFALAGGGTSFGVDAMGSGRSDLFQAGVYLRHNKGPFYVAGALAYGWQDLTADRAVTVAGVDRLRTGFEASAYSGRLESGYRFAVPWSDRFGITPYGGAEFTTFNLPFYSESVVTGTSRFALGYAAKDVTGMRSDFGVRADKSFSAEEGSLTLYGRVAWVHDFAPDRSIVAALQALPGVNFVVSGAAGAKDLGLVAVSAEMKWRSGWSVAATFEERMSRATQAFSGKGSVRYQW
jgi:autotransporter-associated beta strand protein